MKKQKTSKKTTRLEEALIQDIAKRSPLDLLEQGLAAIVEPEDYPQPLRRLVSRVNKSIHIRLSAASRKALEVQSRKKGMSPDELARRWIEQHLRRTGS